MSVEIAGGRMKDTILQDIGKSIKLIQRYAVCGAQGVVVLDGSSWLTQRLCLHLDTALRHGLREPQRGFWPVAIQLSHPSVLRLIRSLSTVETSLGKGLVWLCHTLNEGSLQCYVQCLSNNCELLHKSYYEGALLRDAASVQHLLTLLVGLEHAQFNLHMNISFLGMAANKLIDQNVVSLDPRMTSSITSSLASPVDSGVALLDSDGDCTSASEVTINEADSLSFQDDREVDLLYSEIEDNRINHQLVTLGTCELDQPKFSGTKKSENKTYDMEVVEHSHKYPTSFVDPKYSSAGVKNEENASFPQLLVAEDTFPAVMTQSDILSERVDDVLDRMTQSCMSCIDLKTDNDNKNYALATGSCDNIVFRKQRRKKRNSSDAKVKRVSFHEDIIRRHDNGSASDIVTSKLADRHVNPKDRYSWCGGSEATPRSLQGIIKSNMYLSSSPDLRSCLENNKCNEQSMERNYRVSDSVIILAENSEKVLSEGQKEEISDERGIPEGQEDPPNTSSKHQDPNAVDNRFAQQSSYENLQTYPSFASSMDESDLESMLSDSDRKRLAAKFLASPLTSISFTGSQPELHNMRSRLVDSGLAYKTSILNRFMKSVAERTLKKRNNNPTKTFGSLYVKGLKRQVELEKHHEEEIEEIIEQGKTQARLNRTEISSRLECIFQNLIFLHSDECLYKVFKVRSSYFLDESNEPLLAVLTNACLYLAGMRNHTSFYNQRVIQYEDLDIVIVGPNYQTLLFGSLERGSQVMVATANAEVTSQLMCHLEVAVRRSASRRSLPVVRELHLDDMKSLMHWLRQDVSLDEEDALYHYSLVHLQDQHLSPPSTPLGPVREGHLMFRPATVSPLQAWEAGYFILKGGVVYMFGDKAVGLPKRVIPLTGGHCLGCRRIPGDPRPHTFEIIIGRCKSFQFAAADEYEASDWLQAFVQSASGVYECEQLETIPCSLLLTSQYVLTCQELFPYGPVHILSCVAVKDIVAFGSVSDNQSWCILEFVCREVHESSGDWVLYFTSSAEMQSFRSALQHVWMLEDKGDLPVDNDVDPCFADRCWSTSKMLAEAWDVMLQPV